MENELTRAVSRRMLSCDKELSVLITLCAFAIVIDPAKAQSASLKTDRARVTVASIPDPNGGPDLKVLRTDTNTPLRAGTAWIWEKQRKEEPESYHVSMREKGLNAVLMILFDTWKIEEYTTGTPSYKSTVGWFTATSWDDAAYHLYNNDAAFGAANHAANLRNLHSCFPAWPSEDAFPPGDFPSADGLDTWRSPSFPIDGKNDLWVNQTCERLGLGWSMWFMNGKK